LPEAQPSTPSRIVAYDGNGLVGTVYSLLEDGEAAVQEAEGAYGHSAELADDAEESLDITYVPFVNAEIIIEEDADEDVGEFLNSQNAIMLEGGEETEEFLIAVSGI
jgi:hypothetical protein